MSCHGHSATTLNDRPGGRRAQCNSCRLARCGGSQYCRPLAIIHLPGGTKPAPSERRDETHMITPMVARLVRDPFDRDGWLFELKCLGSHTDNADYDRTWSCVGSPAKRLKYLLKAASYR